VIKSCEPVVELVRTRERSNNVTTGGTSARAEECRPLRGRLAEAVGEPAPVGDRVIEAVGLPEGHVEDRDNLRSRVRPGDATEAYPVGEMSVRVARPVLEPPGECRDWFQTSYTHGVLAGALKYKKRA
jgi:hypothetical protein